MLTKNKHFKIDTLIVLLLAMNLFPLKCRSRSACKYVQSILELHFLLLYHEPFGKHSMILTAIKKKPSENIVGKGGNAGNQHFLLFPQYFLLFQRKRQKRLTFILSSANAFNLVKSIVLDIVW